MASNCLEDLHPDLLPLANEFLGKCKQAGLNITVTCTYRSGEEQDALYAQGRTKPGNIVTNAKAGQSEHNFTIDGKPASKAFDIVPIKEKEAVWNLLAPEWEKIAEIWRTLKTINGFWLDWYGKPGAQFSEKCHFCLKRT